MFRLVLMLSFSVFIATPRCSCRTGVRFVMLLPRQSCCSKLAELGRPMLWSGTCRKEEGRQSTLLPCRLLPEQPILESERAGLSAPMSVEGTPECLLLLEQHGVCRMGSTSEMACTR